MIRENKNVKNVKMLKKIKNQKKIVFTSKHSIASDRYPFPKT